MEGEMEQTRIPEGPRKSAMAERGWGLARLGGKDEDATLTLRDSDDGNLGRPVCEHAGVTVRRERSGAAAKAKVAKGTYRPCAAAEAKLMMIPRSSSVVQNGACSAEPLGWLSGLLIASATCAFTMKAERARSQ